MKWLVGTISAVGVAAAGMSLAPPAMAEVDPGNGAASVTLSACSWTERLGHDEPGLQLHSIDSSG